MATSDEKNSLPAPTLTSILVDMKPIATDARKGASGNWAACGTKVARVKRGLDKRKVRAESESEDGVVKGKVGRSHGAVNWSEDDFTTLLDVVEALLPAGRKAWGAIYSHFEAWAKAHSCPVHSKSTLEN